MKRFIHSIKVSSHVILNKLPSVRYFIQNLLLESKVIFSDVMRRSEDGIGILKVSGFNNHSNSKWIVLTQIIFYRST